MPSEVGVASSSPSGVNDRRLEARLVAVEQARRAAGAVCSAGEQRAARVGVVVGAGTPRPPAAGRRRVGARSTTRDTAAIRDTSARSRDAGARRPWTNATRAGERARRRASPRSSVSRAGAGGWCGPAAATARSLGGPALVEELAARAPRSAGRWSSQSSAAASRGPRYSSPGSRPTLVPRGRPPPSGGAAAAGRRAPRRATPCSRGHSRMSASWATSTPVSSIVTRRAPHDRVEHLVHPAGVAARRQRARRAAPAGACPAAPSPGSTRRTNRRRASAWSAGSRASTAPSAVAAMAPSHPAGATRTPRG